MLSVFSMKSQSSTQNKFDLKVLATDSGGDPEHELALSVLEGFSKRPKGLPSRLFYDDRGSELFQKIMGLDEYYPTNCETEILQNHGGEIASYLEGKKFNLVELGCGDGAKTTILLKQLLQKAESFNFVPLDISKAAIESLMDNLEKEFGEIPFSTLGLVSDYFAGLRWLNENAQATNLVMFLGSNIGNFNKATAMRFLRQLWYSLNEGDLVLIGFDLKKDLDILYDAYNDAHGVTEEFNLNVLDRINETLGADFDREAFQHQGLYSVQTGAMESYLISEKHQTVNIKELDKSFEFQPWEAIHMEYSYKYLREDIDNLSAGTGFEIIKNFTDSKGFFVDSLWRVKK